MSSEEVWEKRIKRISEKFSDSDTALGIVNEGVTRIRGNNDDLVDLSEREKDKILIHELLHIPKTFSGALVPHTCFNKRIDDRRVNKLYNQYISRLTEAQNASD